MMAEVFIDTSFTIALATVHDQYHQKALLLADQLEQEKTHLIITHAVMLEIGNALSKQQYRRAAVKLLRSEVVACFNTYVSLPSCYAQA